MTPVSQLDRRLGRHYNGIACSRPCCPPPNVSKEVNVERKIIYFEKPGSQNTRATLEAVRDRIRELGIKTVVLASTHGETARTALDVFRGVDARLIVTTHSAGWAQEVRPMDDATRRELQQLGATVLTATHALGDDVSSGLGAPAPQHVVAETLYRFCQGMKVCVEIVLMAADAGLIGVDQEVAAVAGTGEGADTAIVVKPAYPRHFKDLKIREILAMPR